MSGAEASQNGEGNNQPKKNDQPKKNRGGGHDGRPRFGASDVRNDQRAPKRNVGHIQGGSGEGNRGRPHPVHNHKVDMKKYEKMIGAAQDNFSDIHLTSATRDDCTICCKPADLFGIGMCRHPVCIECAVRIRILGEQKSCPVCRGDIETLFVTFASSDLSTVNLSFVSLHNSDEERFGIRFENKLAFDRYEKYLAHVCKVCKSDEFGERKAFATFVALRQHMATVHHLSYCHICTDNLNLFSRERKTYSADALGRHIKHGDADDKSQKGHPTCFYCHQRFYDEEARYRHLRKEHFYCQFCEADGTTTNVFFGKHVELVGHYKEKHFLCDSEECKTMGIAFSNVFDLNLHRSREHSSNKKMTLDFVFNDRQLAGPGRTRREPAQPPLNTRFERVALVPREEQPAPLMARPNTEYVVVPSAQSKQPTRFARPNFVPQVQDFPSLGGAAVNQAPLPTASDFPRLHKAKKPQTAPAAAKKKTVTREDEFPSLGGGPSSSSAAAQAASRAAQAKVDWAKHSDRFEVIDDDERMGSHTSGRSPVPQRPMLSQAPKKQPPAASRSTAPKPPPAMPQDDFPSLPPTTGPGFPVVSGKWANAAKGKSAIVGLQMPQKKKVKPPLPVPDLWPERKIPSNSTTVVKPSEEEWEQVPGAKPLTSKELKHQKRKAEREEAQKKAAEKEKERQKCNPSPVEDRQMQAILMNDIASSPIGKSSSVSIDDSSVKEVLPSSESLKKKQPKKDQPAAVIKKVEVRNSSEDDSSLISNPTAALTPLKDTIDVSKDFPSLVKPVSVVKKVDPIVKPAEPVETPASTAGLGSWLSSVFSGLSLSNVMGEGISTSAPLSSMPTTARLTTNGSANGQPAANGNYQDVKPAVLAPPPGLTLQKDSPSSVVDTPPPGFEGVSLMPPPGLENAVPLSMFSMAPLISEADIRKPSAMTPPSDGWETKNPGAGGRRK